LKTTAQMFAGWAIGVLCLSAGSVFAAPAAGAIDLLVATASVAQSRPSEAQNKQNRSEAAELLRRARMAMAENDLEAADALISKAEATGAEYSVFYAFDTPKKARKDLQRKRETSGKTPALPSMLFTPGLFTKKAPPRVDPFLNRKKGSARAEAIGGGGLGKAGEIVPLPAVEPRHSTLPTENPVRSDYPSTDPSGALSPFGRALPTMPPGEGEDPQLPPALRPENPPASASGYAGSPGRVSASLAARRKAAELTRQARAALNTGELDRAESLARQADTFRIADSAFAPGEDRPGLVLLDIRTARQRQAAGMVSADGQAVRAATGVSPFDHSASRAVYDPANDPTRNVPASNQRPIGFAGPTHLEFAQQPPVQRPVQRPVQGPMPARIPSPPPSPVAAAPDGPILPDSSGKSALSLFQQGEAALKAHDTARAHHFFQRAAEQMNQLDPITARRLQSYLQMLSVPKRIAPPAAPAGSVADEAAARQNALVAQVLADVAHQEAKARARLAEDPKGAMALLEETRAKVEKSSLEPAARQRMLARVDRAINDAQRHIEQHLPLIELKEKNERTREEIDRQQRLKLENQEKLALMVDDFNKLMDEQRYPEAEVVAKRASELDPENPVVRQLLWQSKFVRRIMSNRALQAEKESEFLIALDSVDKSSVPFNDLEPYRLPDAKTWEELTDVRKKWLERHQRRSEREIEIEKKLRTPVSLSFHNEPLSNVLDHLAKLAAVNLVLDPQGLAEEGVASNTAVTIEVKQDIMLKSALNLILEPLHLSYVIKDEVLKITSEQLRDGQVYTISYNVADLVMPIPNFVPSTRMGLAGAYHDALGNVGFGGTGPWGTQAGPMAVTASNNGTMNSGVINPELLAQMSRGGATPGNMPMGFGPGGLGGGSQADFDSLTELITSTIQPTTWDEVGGPGSIAGFETNLSLVVSQTQDVHEEIVDLLEQLRRLQDLQVTIEVRFITLNDNFFERIGVDFDFDIDDDIDRPYQVFGRTTGDGDPANGTEPPRNTLDVDYDRSVTVGMQAPGVFSADLDIPFTQNSFGLAVPQFGGFDASAGAQLGFAILSDIEAFFFINAAQGDRRSNVLQAPKVTLFNGQQAYVSDTSQSPFVISVIPVVGDFAAAQQPVIVVLTEGTFMTVQAVVSHDRRFVRLTVVPFFSKIEDVKTFQFEGQQTTTTDTSADNEGWINLGDAADPDWQRVNDSESNDAVTTSQGTTVQLPTFSFVTVTTTVSVPDGGTVLLGGIKRLSEGRNEFGTPILNKIPYINRLFKNVGIGRETQSLMMMVTPRIIIQEEEEEKLGILPP